MRMTPTHKKDRLINYLIDDPIFCTHEFGIDPEANHIYLVGMDDYPGVHEGSEPGVNYMMATRFIKNINLMARMNDDPILIHLKTCFTGKTKIHTKDGYKAIKDVKIGDEVLTHKNRYKKVVDTISQMYDGEMTSLFYGRNTHGGTKIQATSDHPILIERNGKKEWIRFGDVKEGDIIFVESNTCEDTGELVPYWRRRKNYNAERLRNKGRGDGWKHLKEDIIPLCEELKTQGWRPVPVGAGVIPDIIAFKDGKVVAFEHEKMTGQSLKVKKEKYNDAPINDYIDEVVWHTPNEAPKSGWTWYEVDEETGFIKVKVNNIKKHFNKYKQRVYDLTVEDDHSYIANRVVVHNCGGDWAEGMAIYQAIKACPNEVIILNYTHARSMSSLIFLAGDKRVFLPYSTFMFHDGTMGYEGTVKQYLTEAKELEKTREQMMNIYIEEMQKKGKFVGEKASKIKKWLRGQMDRKEEVYLSADEAVELGLGDEIFGADGIYNWEELMRIEK